MKLHSDCLGNGEDPLAKTFQQVGGCYCSKICVAKVWVIMNYVCAKLCKSDFSVTMISHDEIFLDTIYAFQSPVFRSGHVIIMLYKWIGGDFLDFSYSSQGLIILTRFPECLFLPWSFWTPSTPKTSNRYSLTMKGRWYAFPIEKKTDFQAVMSDDHKLSIMFQGSSFHQLPPHSPHHCGPDLFGQCSQLCGVERPILWWSSAQNWSALYQVLCQALGPQHRDQSYRIHVVFFWSWVFQSL